MTDVNGTRYHLLSGARDWRHRPAASTAASDERLAWDPRRGRLTLRRRLFRFPARSAEAPLGPDDRRGAGRDRFGHSYWIDSERAVVLYRPAGSRRSGCLWAVTELAAPACEGAPAGDFRPLAEPPPPVLPVLSGLAVTNRHYLVVGTRDPGGLLVFDLHGGGPPVWWRWPRAASQSSFAPFDLAPAPGGGLWILDRPAAGGLRLWRLDRDLRVVRAGAELELEAPQTGDFRAVGDDFSDRPGRTFPTGLALDLTSPPEASGAVSVIGLPDGSVLLLEPDAELGDTWIHRLMVGRPAGEPISLGGALAELAGEDAELVGHDFAFITDVGQVPGEVTGSLYVASAEGNQSFAFGLVADVAGVFKLTASDAYLPMRRYAGMALVAGGGDVFYDLEDGWLALTEVPRPRYARAGRLDRLVFDGKEPGCVWHRLFLDACIPPGDSVKVESRVADEEELLPQAPWRPEPRPGLRPGGPELPWQPAFGGEHPAAGAGTWELLFQAACGRYLELRLSLAGSGRSTPSLHALRVHYPRFSYLGRYLPAVYREDPASASFLDRFLANSEGFYTEIEGRIARVETLFDARTAPAEALEWLAGWLGAVFEPDWDEARRRLFLAHAFELYRRRGTPRGLLQSVRLAVDECPDESLFEDEAEESPFSVRLVETFRTRSLPGTLLGDPEAAPAGPALVRAADPWQPAHGSARLDQLWRDFLSQRYGPDQQGLARIAAAWGRRPRSWRDLRFAPLTPAGETEAGDREEFLRRQGLPYADVGTADVPAWRAYLRRRYRLLDSLKDAWGLAEDGEPSSFDDIEQPADRLPVEVAPLTDWFRFATLALPVARAAHRFTVLVPVSPERLPDEGRRFRLLERVREVVEREKPVHTTFDVRLYWALFRVGSARVGLDTLLGEGSRFTALTLGAGYLGESLLAENHPWNVRDRRVVGRDLVGEPPPLN